MEKVNSAQEDYREKRKACALSILRLGMDSTDDEPHLLEWLARFAADKVLELEHLSTSIEVYESELRTARVERDAARDQLQAVGRKAFWASRNSPKA